MSTVGKKKTTDSLGTAKDLGEKRSCLEVCQFVAFVYAVNTRDGLLGTTASKDSQM